MGLAFRPVRGRMQVSARPRIETKLKRYTSNRQDAFEIAILWFVYDYGVARYDGWSIGLSRPFRIYMTPVVG